ncbi:MAG: VOC family protein [Opitutaceae bacterium]|nr:VOC family protein [Cytophagales bacterium]
MTTSTHFAHIAVTCNDPVAFEAFYTRHFGMRRARTIPLENGKEIVFLKDSNGFYFEIFSKDEERTLPFEEADGPHYAGVRHIAFMVDDVDQKLKEIGEDTQITLGPFQFDELIPGWKTVWIKDPEGNIVEISQGYKDE